MSEFEKELIQQDEDGWSRSFDDQQIILDSNYKLERDNFWKFIKKLNKTPRPEDNVRNANG